MRKIDTFKAFNPKDNIGWRDVKMILGLRVAGCGLPCFAQRLPASLKLRQDKSQGRLVALLYSLVNYVMFFTIIM